MRTYWLQLKNVSKFRVALYILLLGLSSFHHNFVCVHVFSSQSQILEHRAVPLFNLTALPLVQCLPSGTCSPHICWMNEQTRPFHSWHLLYCPEACGTLSLCGSALSALLSAYQLTSFSLALVGWYVLFAWRKSNALNQPVMNLPLYMPSTEENVSRIRREIDNLVIRG